MDMDNIERNEEWCTQRLKTYLRQKGWLRSIAEKKVIDADGEALPWYTYPMIDFLKSRVSADMEVFEFGCGSSTIWWAKRVKRVISCEHNAEWLETLKVQAHTDNVEILKAPEDEEMYAAVIDRVQRNYHVIVNDGLARNHCARSALRNLREDGVIIWDNSDRVEHYNQGFLFLKENGFRKVDFFGFGPTIAFEWCSSVFYRDNNCLGL